MYKLKEKVVWFAVTSRLAIIFLQFIFNRILPDHDAGVFISPKEQGEEISIYDQIIEYLFGGFLRWDAQYFLHIAKYGYTYENTLAFSPLYPMSVKYASLILRGISFGLNQQSTIIIAASLINSISFIKSVVVFLELSRVVLKNDVLAYKATILFCINPASIFFSAFYSEAMFAWISFYIMLVFVKNNPYIYLPIGLSTILRSNGLINIGFPVYSWLRMLLKYLIPKIIKTYKNRSDELIMPWRCRSIVGSLIWLLNIIFLSLAPYALLQLYNFSLYCLRSEFVIPHSVLKYGLKNNYLIAGTEIPPWCDSSTPIAYSYVQNKYWDVGFMQYYTLKQIPNFLLALPILYIMLSQSLRYLNKNRIELLTLGSFSPATRDENIPSDIFVFVIHGLFLTIFCIIFVHIQVSTRLLCSASPLLYWYCAFNMSHKSDKTQNSKDFEYTENLHSRWRVFFLSQKKYTSKDILILSYFLGYFIAGCIMFPNFLPWT